jgi:hypothetical protein
MSTTRPSPTTPLPRQDPSMDDLRCLLQTSCLNHPKLGETLLRDYFQGASVPADLPPDELVRFTDYVFRAVKQRGIKDPAGWLEGHWARQEEEKDKEAAIALAAAIEREALVETGGDVPIERNDHDPVSIEPLSEPVTATLSPSEIAKDKIAIAGDLYVGFAYLASMLGISERTLARRTANGNGPPNVKISGSYYRLDKIQEWAAAMGLSLKTPLDNH